MRSTNPTASAMRFIKFALPICLVMCVIFAGLSTRRAGAGRPGPEKARAAQVSPPDPLTKGSWSGVIQMKDVPVHISVLPDGRLLYWGRDKADVLNNSFPLDPTRPPDGIPDWDQQGRCNTYLWDPLYAENILNTATVQNTTTNLFCSSHSFLQDGTLLVAGGHKRHFDPTKPQAEGVGEDALNLFDYRSGQWSLLKDASNNQIRMPHGRWYPTSLTLANGETIVMSGSYLNGTDPNTATYRLNTTPDILGLDGSLRQSAFDDPLPGGGNIDGFITSTYPRIFLAPDGRVFYTGAPSGDIFTRFLDTQVTPNVWTQTDDHLLNHDVGSGVMYAPGKVMMVGGRTASGFAEPVNVTEVYDTVSNPNWSPVASMTYPRMHMTGTLLPDGKVMAVGGTKCPGTNEVKWNLNQEVDSSAPPCDNGQVLTPELYDPAANTWTQLASHQETRVYHSTSILLPDGRVLVSGSGLPLAGGETAPDGTFCYGETARNSFSCRNNGHKNAEIFSPPYLFELVNNVVQPAKRPEITYPPEGITYGKQFDLGIANVPPSDIKEVVLVRLPSVTHGFGMDQRRVVLPFQVVDSFTLKVTAPADGKECPPGPYMLFLIRNNGRNTPSHAKIVRVGSLSLDRAFHLFTSQDMTATPLNSSVMVKAAPGVNWTATAAVAPGDPMWLGITSGASGTGDGTINFVASPNTTQNRREARITISITGQKFTTHTFSVYQGGEFTDVPSGFWAYKFISRIYGRGVTGGTGGGNYSPGTTITRGQMAVYLGVAMGLPDPTVISPANQSFADVPPGSPYYKWVEAIARRGITGGCGGGNFCPDQVITRAQAAVFLMSAIGANNPPPPSSQTFIDVPPSSPYYRFVEEFVRRGVTGGCGAGQFCPDSPVNRDTMAVFVHQAFKLGS